MGVPKILKNQNLRKKYFLNFGFNIDIWCKKIHEYLENSGSFRNIVVVNE